MPGPGADSVNLDGIFKRRYDTDSEAFVKQQNLKTFVFPKLKKSSIKPSAQGIFMPVVMSGNESGGAQNEREGFRQIQAMNPVQPQITAKNNFWPCTITEVAVELSKGGNEVAFAEGIDAQQNDDLKRMFSDINRQACGVGMGVMATVSVAALAGATTVTVSNTLPFRRNMVIDFWTDLPANAGTKQATATVTAVNYLAGTISVSALPANVSLSDIIVKQNILDNPPTDGKELTGLRKMADTTNFGPSYEGVTVASNPEWQGIVTDAGSVPISHDFLQKNKNRLAAIGDSTPNFLISNYGQARNFANTELPKTRYEPAQIKAGYTVLKWGELEWLVDKDWATGEVGMYDLDQVFRFETEPPHLSKLTGSTTYQITGFPMVGWHYTYIGNIGTWKRNSSGRIINLTEPTL